MKKIAVLLYPDFSLQEITCLTSALTIWYGEQIDYIASGEGELTSEEGLRVVPAQTTGETRTADYDCVILPGTINPLPALFDEELIRFLRQGVDTETVFAAVSSAPILLSKAGILHGRKFTAGYFMQMAETFDFVEKEQFIHKGVVEDGNVITGIGMFFREFAQTVLRRLGYDPGEAFMCDRPEDFTDEDLTFYWSDEDYREFLEELKGYTGE